MKTSPFLLGFHISKQPHFIHKVYDKTIKIQEWHKKDAIFFTPPCTNGPILVINFNITFKEPCSTADTFLQPQNEGTNVWGVDSPHTLPDLSAHESHRAERQGFHCSLTLSGLLSSCSVSLFF